MSKPRRRPSLRFEPLEDRTTPALIGLEAADVPVSVTAGVDGGGDIAMRADGSGFVVTYQSPDASGGGVFFKRYDANWQLVQGPVAVNTFTTNDQQVPSIAMDSAGNFVIAYQSFGQDPGDTAAQSGIYARRFNATGSAIDGAEFQVNTTTISQQRDPDVGVNAAGQFTIAYRTGVSVNTILAQSYSSVTGALTTVGGEATVKLGDGGPNNATAPAVAVDSSGNYVVSYQANGLDTSGFGIYFQRMTQAGATTGSETQVNTTTAGDQQFPDVAMDGSGNFNIVWYSPNVDGSGTAVVLRRFNTAGAALSGETQVNTGITTNNQINAHISFSSAGTGTYLVTWSGEEADLNGTGADAYFKTYSTAGSVLIGDTAASPSTVNNNQTEDNVVGAINPAGDFVLLFDSGASGTFDTFLRRYGEDADVSFAAGSSNAAESSNASINLTRTGAAYVLANTATTVQVTRTGGTATPGTDFTTSFPTSVVIAAGSASQPLSIVVTDDTTDEPDETVALQFGTVTNGTAVGQTTHTYTITDNDPPPSISVGSPSVTETNAGTTTLTFTISLSAASGNAVTGNYATADGSATAGSDYVALGSTPFTIAAGATSTTVSVTVNGDTTFENNETLTLNLTGVANTSNATASGTGTITNDDTAPNISVSSPSVTEGDSGLVNLTFTLSLSAASGVAVSGNYATANTSATAGTDYTALPSTPFTIAAGATSTTVTVQVTGDTLYEAGNETLALNLTGVTGTTNATASGTGTIVDDDAAATITISSGNNQSTIAGTNFASPLVALVRNANNNAVQGVTVTFTAPGAGASFTPTPIPVTTNASGLASTGTITANATAGGPYTVSAAATGGTSPTVNFSLTNLPPTNFSIGDVSITEGNGGTSTLTFTVTASPAPTATATVNWATADGTATTADGDYAGASGTLTFTTGVTTQTISITINGDTKFEGNETFVVNLSGATNAGISDNQGVGTINNDDTAPTLSINDVTLAEGNGGTTAFTFTVTQSAASGLTTTANYATADGTALAGSDYVANSGTVTFAPGVTTQTVTVLANGDTVFENTQAFTVTLSAPTNATVATGTGTGTITNDDAAPTLAINSPSASESAGPLTFTVTRTGATEVAIAVNYATADGTAVSVAGGPGTPDFTSTSGTLNFAPSLAPTATQSFTVALTNDTVYEATEQFTATLAGPSGATIATGTGTATITNDDAAPSLAVNDFTVSESGVATFTVTLTGATALPIAVNFATADGTAVATAGGPGTPDYTSTSGTLNFAASASATQTLTVTVPLTNDTTNEATEQFVLNLSGATNGATISDTQGVATVTDDDAVPSLSVTDVTLAEGNSGTTAFTFTVSLSAASAQTVTVAYAAADGTALAGSDYTTTSGTLTFAPGVTTQTVTVLVTGDTVFENTQTFTVNLSAPTNATIADNQGVGTITNDDAAPTLAINDVTVSEAAGTLTFIVTRTGATELSIGVSYATADGTAVSTAGGPGTPDFTATTGSLTFNPSLAATLTQTFTVTLTNDAVYEALEQFTVALSGPTSATISDGTGLATITNDDAAPSLSVGDITVSESGTATFTVTLTGATALPIAVDFATADGTAVSVGSATPGTPDYTTTTGTLTFAPSASATQTLTITVPLTDDTTAEDTETFVVNLSNASNAATISDAQAVGTITNDDPVPTVSVDSVTQPEGDSGTTAFTFTVTLSAASAQTITVDYQTADGTALAGSDYTATSGTLTFAPGVTTQTVTVLVTGDTVFEADQTFTLSLVNGTNVAPGAQIDGTGTITNDDAAPTLAINDVTVSESAGTLTFTVTRTGATEVPIGVDYATADDSAVSTAAGPGTPDYTSTSGTLNFAPSLAATATQTFTVTLTNDNVYEAIEQFFANLSNPTGATIADGVGLATVTNDDAAPSLSVGDITVSESGTATFTVTLTGATALPIAVDFATADGTAVSTATATPGTPDYTTTTGTLTFAPSASATQTLTITVPLTDDTTAEDTETFVVNLSNASNAATISDAQAVGTITNDDPVPTVSVDSVTQPEGDSGTTAFTFTVTLSAASAQTITVDYQTADGTALAGSDYTATSGTLTFAPGVTTQTVTVLVTGDTVFEADQTFTLSLVNGTNVAPGAQIDGTGTITNDDAAPTLAINDVTVSESAGTLTFTVTRTGATEVPIGVDYATADDSAVSTAAGPGTPDYTSTSGTLNFAPSLAATATQTFTVTLTNDNVYEAIEQFFANLSNPTGATIADGVGLATVTNDDAAPTISIGDTTASENGTLTFTVTLTGATALPIAVDFATADGTAVSAATATPGTPDYTTSTGTLTFAPSASGTQTLTVTVPLTNDTTNEATEQFVLNLSNPSNASTISDAQAVGTITNDDPPPSASVDDVTLAEGNAGTTAFTFTVTLSAPSAQTITVNFATADGTATGTDYTGASGTLTFAPGVTTQTVTVLVTGDTVFEADQTFVVNLSSPTNATIADGVGVGTVTNDDAAPTLSINGVVVSEGAGTLQFTVTRTGATEVPVTVNYATANGTALAGSDYTATSGTLTFAPSLAALVTQTFSVPVTGDTADELTETLTASISGATGATIATATDTSTITDDDLPVAVADTAGVLEDGDLTAPSVLANDNAAPGSVAELVGTGTANGTLTLNPDGTFTYAPDADFNGTDTFQYRVRNPENEVSGTTVTVTVTAVNDAPSFTAGPSQTVGRGGDAEAVAGWATGISAGPADEAGQALSFLVTVTGTTNTLRFDTAPAVDPVTGALTFKPTATTFGTATVSVRLADGGGTANGGVDTSAAQTFTITVTRKSTGDDTPVDQLDFAQFAASPGPGGPGTADVFNPNGSKASSTAPFGAGVGVRAVLADVTGDGVADLVAGSGVGVPGRLVVTDPTSGKTILSDFPFGAGFTGGLFVAAGDVNGDGRADVIVTPDASGGGRVVIYDGATGQVVASFLGIDDQKFRGGARVAVGDVNGDGVTDVIVSAGLLGGPRVAVFDGTSLVAGGTPRKLINDFFAFEESLRDGVYVAAGDLNGDGFADLIFGGGPGGGARVLARDGKSLFGPGASGQFVALTNFIAGDSSLRDGVQVAVKNSDGDGLADLVTAVQTPKGPEVRLYLGKDLGPNGGAFTTDLDPYPGLLTGIYVG